MSTYPNKPISSIMSYCECGTGNCAVDVFISLKSTNIEIGDVGGLDTFSVKECGVETIFSIYAARRSSCLQKVCQNDSF
jgi:hypothetical protein